MKLSYLSRFSLPVVDPALCILLLLTILAIAVRHPAILVLQVISSAYVIYRNRAGLINIGSEEKMFGILIIFSCVAMLPISLLRNPNSAFHFITVFIGIISAAALVYKPDRFVGSLKIILSIYQFFILIYLFFFGAEEFPLDHLLEQSSSNGLTSYLICLQICYLIANICVFSRAGIITPAVTLWISTVGYGRGSIIASAMILAVALAYDALLTSNRKLRAAYMLGFFVILGYLLYNYDSISSFIFENTKLGSGIFDVERYIINTDYWSRINGINILIGVDYKNTVIERFYNGNPHNTFIRAHNIFGIFYLASIGAAILFTFVKRSLDTRDVFIGTLILIMLSRAFTETFLFPTPLDAMFFASLILARRRLS